MFLLLSISVIGFYSSLLFQKLSPLRFQENRIRFSATIRSNHSLVSETLFGSREKGLTMADEIVINGGDDRREEIVGSEEDFVDFDESESKASGLMQRIEALEVEKRKLVRENEEERERVKNLKKEIEGLEGVVAELKTDNKGLESVAARASQLEIEVSRMQHDLISSMSEGEEANKEVSELKRVVEELKRSISEKGLKVEVLEKERNLLLEKMDKDAEGVQEAKAVTESRVRELEKKIEALEGRESSEKGERIKVEQEARAKIDEKEGEIRQLKKWVEDLDSVVVKNGLEMEKMKKEREEIEIVKNELEGLLKKSERKGKEMENKMAQLHKELEASEQMIIGLKEKTLNDLNGKAIIGDDEMGSNGLKQLWPVVAGSTGTIAAIAVIYYLRCAMRR
ncbi:unnamed protein product [Camellia sinensis]